jgi:hypothetical protein
MIRVQNQDKRVVSSGPSIVVVARGDLQVARRPDQNKIHSPRTVYRYLKGACH